jgi:hypothetical protein
MYGPFYKFTALPHPADGKHFSNFVMPWNRLHVAIGRVHPERMGAAFTLQVASMLT